MAASENRTLSRFFNLLPFTDFFTFFKNQQTVRWPNIRWTFQTHPLFQLFSSWTFVLPVHHQATELRSISVPDLGRQNDPRETKTLDRCRLLLEPGNPIWRALDCSCWCKNYCFICRPSDPTLSMDARIESRPNATFALAVRLDLILSFGSYKIRIRIRIHPKAVIRILIFDICVDF